MMTELHCLTIAEAGRLIKAKKLSPLELTRALLSRIEALDRHVNAFITLTAERALDQAKQAEAEIAAGRYRGPLHGIPIGIKDIYRTAGILTTANSRLCRNHVPATDATAVAKLHAAGAVIMGKLAAHEFAHGGPSFDLPWPPARNPWHTAHFTGGSSSGSAAAVAAGFVPGALGSDTGGSIRGPASLCGIAGLKPTYGLLSRAGVIPNSFSLDHCGPMAWTVEDCATLLQVLAGYDPQDPTSIERPPTDYSVASDPDIRGVRVGVIRHFWEQDLPVGREMQKAVEGVVETLRRLGARIVDCRMRPLQDYRDVKMMIGETELFSIHHRNLVERMEDFGADFLGRTTPACLFQAADYMHAQRERRRMISEMAPLYEEYDVLLTAGLGPAPLLAPHHTIEFWRKPNITTPFNVTGGPALALCCGFSESGLPLGVQIAGRPFNEAMVLRVGHAYEQAAPWRAKRPVIAQAAAETTASSIASNPSTPVAVDAPTRQAAKAAAEQAGLRLNELQFSQLCEAAPYALAIAQRLRRDRPDREEPASVFMLRK